MKPIIIAIICSFICFLAITIVFHAFVIARRAKVMFWLFILGLPILIFLHKTLPPDLYFLPKWAVSYYELPDLWFALFLYTSGFFGGILQLYNLADRGFSLRILIDIMENPNKYMKLEDVMSNYSRGRGIDWMYEKRLQDMLAGHLIELHSNQVAISNKGLFLANIFKKLRVCVNLPFTEKIKQDI